MISLPLFLLLAFLAEFLGTLGGFGSSMLFVPLAGYFLDFRSVLGITALFHILSNLTKMVAFREGFDRKLLINLGIPAVGFVIIGALLTESFPPGILKILLGIFLIVLSGIFIFIPSLSIKPSKRNVITGGILSGFIAGLLGTGGAVRGLVLSSFKLPPGIFIATSAMIDLAIDSSRGVIYFFEGYIHIDDLYLLPYLWVISIAGTYAAKYILKKLSHTVFQKGVLILILATGLFTLAGAAGWINVR